MHGSEIALYPLFQISGKRCQERCHFRVRQNFCQQLGIYSLCACCHFSLPGIPVFKAAPCHTAFATNIDKIKFFSVSACQQDQRDHNQCRSALPSFLTIFALSADVTPRHRAIPEDCICSFQGSEIRSCLAPDMYKFSGGRCKIL